ncbi:MAG TPA: phage tail assembly chaperone [Sphingomonadaceae bacterium]|nr:phage tail assembly chaperone [Sphingomonadaceae bacterium]
MSGDSFAGAAVRLAGFAGAVLGWRPGEFWAATPAELGVVVEAMRGEGESPIDRADFDELRAKFPDDGARLDQRHREERSDVAIQS